MLVWPQSHLYILGLGVTSKERVVPAMPYIHPDFSYSNNCFRGGLLILGRRLIVKSLKKKKKAAQLGGRGRWCLSRSRQSKHKVVKQGKIDR